MMDPKMQKKVRVKSGEIQRLLLVLNETLLLDYEHQIVGVTVCPFDQMVVEIEVARVP